ncbi:MAG: NAD-dependent epimerase/dehydratase family protein, partial [Burkholderiales bacterium]
MRVFVTGASGYIGGSVAAALRSAGHEVVGLVRSPQKAQQAQALGVEPVSGTLDDGALLERQARAADAVVHAADADHQGAVV